MYVYQEMDFNVLVKNFNESMGFDVELAKDYAGEGQNRIVFSKKK